MMLEEDGADQSVGERLRAAREAQGLAIEEVASRTRVPTRHLQMIERGDYAGLPAPTYSTGFIKAYARLVGLDGQALSTRFRQEIGRDHATPTASQSYEPADPRRSPPAALALLMLMVAFVAGLGYLYWRGTAETADEIAAAGTRSPTDAAAPSPRAAAIARPQPAATQPGRAVSIGATEEVWIKVSDTGRTLFMGVLAPGNRFQVPADAAAPVLTTGRPGATTISVGATAIPTVGDPRRAARDVSLKADDLLARVVAPGDTVPSPAPPPAASAG